MVTELTITLPDAAATMLREKAERLGVTPEELAQSSIESLIREPDEAFKATAEYVLRKNAELYRRLS